MKRDNSRSLGQRIRTMAVVVALLALTWGIAYDPSVGPVDATNSKAKKQIPNNHPMWNPGGKAATFSTQGFVELTVSTSKPRARMVEVARPAISRRRPGASPPVRCNTSLTSRTAHTRFSICSTPTTQPWTSLRQRRVSSPIALLLTRGVFRRGGTPRPNSEWELIAVDDPHGYANLNRLVHWRRSMPTINFAVGSATINWDGGNSIGTDQHAGLVNQATRNVTGGQQGQPATTEVIANIVAFEESLSTAQLIVPERDDSTLRARRAGRRRYRPCQR